jgi:Mor family transcriptional regulator
MDELKQDLAEICEEFKEGEKLAREAGESEELGLLAEKIRTIKFHVIKLERMINGNKDVLENYKQKAMEISRTYRDKRVEMISSNLREVFILICSNLSNEIIGEIDDKDMCLTLKKEEKVMGNMEETKNYTEIGKVIRLNSKQNKFKVTLNGENIKEYEEEFELDSLTKIYSVANSINTNLLLCER